MWETKNKYFIFFPPALRCILFPPLLNLLASANDVLHRCSTTANAVLHRCSTTMIRNTCHHQPHGTTEPTDLIVWDDPAYVVCDLCVYFYFSFNSIYYISFSSTYLSTKYSHPALSAHSAELPMCMRTSRVCASSPPPPPTLVFHYFLFASFFFLLFFSPGKEIPELLQISGESSKSLIEMEASHST